MTVMVIMCNVQLSDSLIGCSNSNSKGGDNGEVNDKGKVVMEEDFVENSVELLKNDLMGWNSPEDFVKQLELECYNEGESSAASHVSETRGRNPLGNQLLNLQ